YRLRISVWTSRAKSRCILFTFPVDTRGRNRSELRQVRHRCRCIFQRFECRTLSASFDCVVATVWRPAPRVERPVRPGERKSVVRCETDTAGPGSEETEIRNR